MKIVNSIPDRVRAERLARADQAALRELAVVMRCGNGVCQTVRNRDRPIAKKRTKPPRVAGIGSAHVEQLRGVVAIRGWRRHGEKASANRPSVNARCNGTAASPAQSQGGRCGASCARSGGMRSERGGRQWGFTYLPAPFFGSDQHVICAN